MNVTPRSFNTALAGQLYDEFGPGGTPAGLQAARELMEFLSHRMPREEFRVLLSSDWQEIGSRLEEAAREHQYAGVVPALRPSEAGMLVCCSAGALADLKAAGRG
ncbi:hypothetical protein [Streptomyces erythrochromogenes]|uniref:hypothetical protein n=1 Tax=Streptomyces erythrochromogenes TaxID=285574 RepID=UPI0036B6F50A